VVALVGDKRDPGYWSTARMVLEAGLTLALDVRLAPGAWAPPAAPFEFWLRLPGLGVLGWVGSTDTCSNPVGWDAGLRAGGGEAGGPNPTQKPKLTPPLLRLS